MRALAYACLSVLAGCAALPHWGSLRPPGGRLLAGIRVTRDVDNAVVSGPQVAGYCATRWQLRADTLDIVALAQADSPEASACQGNPVFLVRPMCALTTRETLFYPQSTPVVAIRCPYGAAGYVTGFSKATRGAQ